MKILFSPEYSGHVFLGLNEEHDSLMDTMACDVAGLMGVLELRMGIHQEEQPSHYRAVEYYKAMSTYMEMHPDNVLTASFKLSSLGTAEQALQWRDHLVMDGWTPAINDSSRLDVLASTEAYFDAPGLVDRMKTVVEELRKLNNTAFEDLQIILPCEQSLLHPAISSLLNALVDKGVKVEEPTVKDRKESNLSRLSQLLESNSEEKLVLDKEDDSFLIYEFADENAANEYFAMKGESLHADVWINDNNKALDNWLRMMGKPTMGSSLSKSVPQVVQLFILGIAMMKEPLNIQCLINWLYSPMQPLGSFFGGILADKIIDQGGYRNEACKTLVENYIEGKYTFHDAEKDQELSEEELAKRDKKERGERQLLVETYLPALDAGENVEVKTSRLKVYLNSLAAWARNRAHFLSEKPDNEGWCSQLETLASMCDTFVMLLEASNMGEVADMKQVDTWISTLYKGSSFVQYGTQQGCLEMISDPAKMAASSEKTIWMNFSDKGAGQLDCGFLYPTEKNKVMDRLTLWDEQKENKYHQIMELTPFILTKGQMILVITDYTAGEVTQTHPFMVRLKSQVTNLNDFIRRPNLLGEEMEDVELVRNNNTQVKIEFDYADLLKWPDYTSPTTLSTMVEYPLDYLFERLLNIVPTGQGSIRDVKTTKGIVAHAVIQNLFAPRDGKTCSKPNEIEVRIKNEFESQVRQCIESCGAILFLPENKLDAELLAEQLRKCLDILLDIIRENNLVVTGCEERVTKDMKFFDTDRDWDMIGFIDMTLEDANHHPVVFDFKWTGSKYYYRDTLAANRSTQLELYRDMLGTEKRDTVEKTGYFLMPEGHLYSKEHFDGLNCTQIVPENKDNIVEQLRKSFFYRKQQLESGVVEVDEGFPSDMLDYVTETETEGLFPLNMDKNVGQQKENGFSKYKLFKGIGE